MARSLQERKKRFLEIFRLAKKKYGKSKKRLAGEGWDKDWKLLIATIMSAQSRDEVTIPIAEKLFKKFPTLKKLANASEAKIKEQIRSINYYKSKAKHIKGTAVMLLSEHEGRVPDDLDELIKLPGVGRKTANLLLSELHKKDSICVDTHVHRISNVFGIVDTKTPHQTEEELKKVAPKKYWSKINRLFVLWGKEAPGRDKDRLLEKLKEDFRS